MASEFNGLAEERVLVLAPTGRDGPLVGDVLRKAGIAARECGDAEELRACLAEASGAVLVAEEALTAEARRALGATLRSQPPWSDIPLLVFTSRATPSRPDGDPLRGLADWNVSLLERPVGVNTLVNAASSALRDRRRQYAVRDLLRQLETLNQTLEARVAERTARLEEHRDQLKSLAVRLTATEQRERRRISVELHDYLAQLLLVIRMRVQCVKTEEPGSVAALADAAKLLGEATRYTRTLMSDLSPPALYELGLEAALESWADEMHERHGLEVELTVTGHVHPLPEDLRVVIFECVRELLFNVVKHAKVARARLVLDHQPGAVRIGVEDAGPGFEAAAIDSRPGQDGGWGLFNIRERVESLGGRFDVDAAPGRGARFTLTVPVTDR